MIGNLDTFGGLYKIGKCQEFYSAFNSYVTNKENQSFWEFFNTRRFRISPNVISSRTMNHWQKQGLLPENCQEEGQKWRSFTLMDLIWVATVKELSILGVKFSIIREVKKIIVTRYNKCEYGELEFYTALAYLKKVPCEILIFSDNTAEVATVFEVLDSKEKYGMITNINISINSILQSIFKDQNFKPVYDKWVDLEEQEIHILDRIKSGNYDEISLKLSEGKVINLTGNKNLNGKNSKLYEIQKEGGNQDLIVKIRNGEVRHIKQTKIEQL